MLESFSFSRSLVLRRFAGYSSYAAWRVPGEGEGAVVFAVFDWLWRGFKGGLRRRGASSGGPVGLWSAECGLMASCPRVGRGGHGGGDGAAAVVVVVRAAGRVAGCCARLLAGVGGLSRCK